MMARVECDDSPSAVSLQRSFANPAIRLLCSVTNGAYDGSAGPSSLVQAQLVPVQE
jgi:hypothetical protein